MSYFPGSCERKSREGKQPKTGISCSKHSIDKAFSPRRDNYLGVLGGTVIGMFKEIGPDQLPSFSPKIILPVTGSEMEHRTASSTPPSSPKQA